MDHIRLTDETSIVEIRIHVVRVLTNKKSHNMKEKIITILRDNMIFESEQDDFFTAMSEILHLIADKEPNQQYARIMHDLARSCDDIDELVTTFQ